MTPDDTNAWISGDSTPIPLYHRISLILRQRITSSVYGDSGLLPGEHELAAEFGVSRTTIARTLSDLAAQGLLSRRRGIGTRVISPPAHHTTNMESLLESLVAIVARSKVEVLDFGYGIPPRNAQEALRSAASAEVQRAVRIRSIKGRPFSIVTSYVPAELGRTFNAKDLARQPLLKLLEEAGAIAVSAKQTVSAMAAEPMIARALETDIGQPLIAVDRIIYDKHSKPIEFIQVLYHPGSLPPAAQPLAEGQCDRADLVKHAGGREHDKAAGLRNAC